MSLGYFSFSSILTEES